MTWRCHRCARAWALVPVKAPGRAKMRLSPVLSPDERAALQRAMLSDMLLALSRATSLAGVAVISPDRDVAAVAGRHGATFIAERRAAGDLNGAVAAGAESLRRAGAATIAVIPADVPLLNPADVDRAVIRAEVSAATVVVPDRHRQGTNALVFDAEARPEFVYGPDSLRRHAAAAGPPVVLLPLASFARDIDTPADLVGLAGKCAAAGARETAAVMAAIGERSPTSVLKENQR